MFENMTKVPLESLANYENKDPRCVYPFTLHPLGYCWGYATNVDKNKTKTEHDEFCSAGCDMWIEKK